MADARLDSETRLLVERLAQAESALEAAMAGSIDSVTYPNGHTYLLRDAQQALLRSEELANEQAALLRTIVESAPDLVAYVGMDRRVRYLNRSIDGETVGTDWLSLQLPEHQEGLKRAFEQVVATGDTTTFESPGLAADATTAFYSRRFGAVVQDAQVVGVVVVSRDVTQQRAEQQAVRLQANLLDQVAQAVIATDTSGNITYVNRFAGELYGWPCAEMVNRDVLGFLVPGDSAIQARAIQERVQHGESWTGELILQDRELRTFPVFLTASPLFDEANRLLGIINVTFDLSAQKRSAALLSIAARVGRLGAWQLEVSPRKLVWSDEVRVIHGVPTDYVPSLEDALAFYPPEAKPIIAKAVEACISEGTPFDMELQIVAAQGRRTWVRVIGEAQRDGGTIRRIHGALQDISQARQAADLLRFSEERFRLLARATNDTVWDWDMLTGAHWWNEAVETVFGYAADGILSTAQFRLDRIHPEDLQATNARVQEAIDGGKEKWWGEYRFRRSDGGYTPVVERGYIMRDDAGRATRMIGGMTDLTERKAIAAGVAQQAVLLDAASDAIYQMDLDGRVLSWNRSAETIYGWTAAEAVGEASRELLFAEASEFDLARWSLFQEERWRGEVCQRTKTGHSLTIEARWTLVRDDYKKPASILAINTDITEKKKLEAQFLRAQRMESVGTLAGGIAHDLNNILAPILMGVANLQEAATNDDTREILETLRSCSQRGADLVRQVLSFARGVEGERLLVQPTHLMREIEQIIRQTFPKNIDFRLNHPRSLWAVNGDPTQLHQVFMNLCVNARDAMPKGGALTVTMVNATLDATYAGMNLESRPGNYVVVEVADTGQGIAPEIREKIFEPFFTTKQVGKGTGLGLSTTATIVRSHEGFITVYSEIGRGTVFKVYLPTAETSSLSRPPPAKAEAAQLPRGNGELILVVDDEAAVRHITKTTLESFGYRALLAEDGAQAIGLFAQRRGEISLVLTDMMMPIMDGPALIAALYRIDPRVRVIAASGLHAGGDVARAALAGVVHFLAKPYTAETMLTLLKTALAEGSRS